MKMFAMALLAFVLTVAPLTSAAADSAAEKTYEQAWQAYNLGAYKKTLKLLHPLASEGHSRAQVLLGRCYENGLGVEQNLDTAAQWYQLAAEQNNREAQVLLAYCYNLGAGVPKDPRAALNLLQQAADGGYAEAQYALALHYVRIKPQTAENHVQAFNWAKKAADQGYGQAERFVAACYEMGIGVDKNEAEAALWYARAKAKGFERDGSVMAKVWEYTME